MGRVGPESGGSWPRGGAGSGIGPWISGSGAVGGAGGISPESGGSWPRGGAGSGIGPWISGSGAVGGADGISPESGGSWAEGGTLSLQTETTLVCSFHLVIGVL